MGRWNKDSEPRYRKPEEGALHIRQVPGLSDAFRTWLLRHGYDYPYYGQKMGQEGWVNSIIAEFLTQPPEEQARRIAAGRDLAEAQEREWNREMHPLVEAGILVADEKGKLWKAEEWAKRHASLAHKSTGGRPTRPRAPKAGRKRA